MGSAAREQRLPAGGDVDLCIVVPGAAEPDWAVEEDHAGVPVEVFPLGKDRLASVPGILADPFLPFNLAQSIILLDPDGRLRSLRREVAPELCGLAYITERAETTSKQANHSFALADRAFAEGDPDTARLQLTTGLWHTAHLASVLLCRCPTTRRAFVHVWEAAARLPCTDCIPLARDALGAADLTRHELERLAVVAGEIKSRYRAGIEAMLRNGEVEPAAWPLLTAAVWTSAGARMAPLERRAILSALTFATQQDLEQRGQAGAKLLEALEKSAP